MWYKNKVVVSPGETIYEIITEEDKLSFGIAIADIEKSEEHYHDHTLEIYSVIEGVVELTIGGRKIILAEGESTTIPPGPTHSAKSLSKKRARVEVTSKPPWSLDDHHIVK